MRSYWKYSKANNCRHMKNNTGGLVVTKTIREDHKTIYLTKVNYYTQTKRLKDKMRNFYVKTVMVAAGVPPSICEETVCRVLQKAGQKWAHVDIEICS